MLADLLMCAITTATRVTHSLWNRVTKIAGLQIALRATLAAAVREHYLKLLQHLQPCPQGFVYSVYITCRLQEHVCA